MAEFNNTQKTILWAMDICLREIVRLLVKYRIPASTIYRIMRHHYINEAKSVFEKDGVAPNHSKISQVTGLARRDVAKYEAEGYPVDLSGTN
ncbi:MAG: hypothetical protein HQL32_13315, partial [Planctomycetes bacterium]|nr:hypothetical protein [Planctomycetota bacterium]